jgi:superfamily I DNA/RNA helicase
MDWIRSGFAQDAIDTYLSIERLGRHVPFDARARNSILDGLKSWQEKMRFVGVIDHLGLASALSRYQDRMEATFSHILIDEAQDFGTLELGILRRLVSEGPNDLFLCGDPVQRVHAKRRVLSQAGIDLPSARSFALKRNYRNSREILSLADAVLVRALEACREAGGDDPEVARIEPELAARSGPLPLLLLANSLQEEIAFALRYADETEASETKRICIALAGFSLREVQMFARRINLPVLDGTIGLGAGKVFLSDLEQTKGYEFDTICVLNCAEGIIPDPRMPIEEQFTVASRFYVAMTRAKRELILSCSGNPSKWLADLPLGLAIDQWSENVDISEVRIVGSPEKLPELPEAVVELGGLNGPEFLFTRFALGMSPERQLRLRELIPGRATYRDGQQTTWRNLSSALFALETRTFARRAFGPEASRYFQNLFSRAGVTSAPDRP